MSRTSDARVTVLMPVYNGAHYLDAQIESILSQTESALRLVIWDDGRRMTADRSARGSRNRTIALPSTASRTNLGLLKTIELLTIIVDTPFFALSDQDDLWDSEKLAASLELLEATGSVLVYSDVRTIDADDQS